VQDTFFWYFQLYSFYDKCDIGVCDAIVDECTFDKNMYILCMKGAGKWQKQPIGTNSLRTMNWFYSC